MRILVTGSLGTIGRHLVPELASRGHEVFGCDLYHQADEHAPHFQNGGTYMKCDVSEYRQVEATLGYFEPEMVYHAAAEFGRWNGEDFYETLWRTNVIGTKHILRLQETMGFRLVHFSSSEVYGDMDAVLHEKFSPCALLNDYAMTKWVNEQQIHNSGGESVIVRLFNTYGPGERYSPYRSVNCQFLYRAMKGLPLTVHHGHYRTSTYVTDTVRTLGNLVVYWHPGTTYNIAGDAEHSIDQLAAIALEVTRSCLQGKPIDRLPPEPLTATRKIPDITLAKRDLDHRITVDLETGMRLTAEWMRKEYGM